ncbi:hypothetical protein [Streptomyces sp. NPDC029721]|uniref:hypothetical protein n=1 Tax=Streptomyces sp. NPDC029721 TaxID=3157090 RepID=UPI0033FA6D2B
MLMVHLTLTQTPTAAGTESEAALLQDSIWANAGPQHALEHARVRPARYGIDVVLFLRADGEPDACAKADSLLTQVLRAPALGGYRLALAP